MLSDFKTDFFIHDEEYKVNLKEESLPLIKDWSKLREMKYQSSVAFHEIYTRKDYFKNSCRIYPGDVVVDVGSNIGIFASLAFDMGAIRVICFEPDFSNYELTKLNNPNAEVFNMAVSDSIGEVSFFKNKDSYGGHTIKEECTVASMSEFSEPSKVRVVTLNKMLEMRYIDKINFLKVDCEGSEIDVFNGLSDENLNKIDNISMEYHHNVFNHDYDTLQMFLSRFTSMGFNVFTDSMDNNFKMIYISRNPDILN